MTFDDFVTHFTEISVCHLLNTSHFTIHQRWSSTSCFGEWTTGTRGSSVDRAGGCANNEDTFLRNPQYRFDISGDNIEVIVQLSQPDVRDKRAQGVKNITIGVHILKVEENRKYRIHAKTLTTVGSSDYIQSRSVIFRKSLGRGRYILLPTTFAPDTTGDYLLRFFTTCHANLSLLKQDAPQPSPLTFCCIKPPILVTSLTVRGVKELKKPDTLGSSLDPYCIVTCEGDSVRSAVVKSSTEATWDLNTIFYRKNKNQINVEVWDKNMVKDTFLGQGLVDASEIGHQMSVEVNLTGRKDKSKESMPGRLSISYLTEEDFLAL